MNQKDLWSLTPDEFNQWRKENDLPRLLAFFKGYLPFFSEWLDEFGITDSNFCNAPHTGEWFIGDGDFTFVQYSEDEQLKFVICTDFEARFHFLSKHRSIINNHSISFIPYLCWGKKKTNTKQKERSPSSAGEATEV